MGDIAGGILTGGDSSRFRDGHKSLATLDGEYLLSRVLARFQRRRPDLMALHDENQRGPPVAETLRPHGALTLDGPGFSGVLTGLSEALDAVKTPWLFGCG